MKKHLGTIIMLVVAVVAFGMTFFVEEKFQFPEEPAAVSVQPSVE